MFARFVGGPAARDRSIVDVGFGVFGLFVSSQLSLFAVFLKFGDDFDVPRSLVTADIIVGKLRIRFWRARCAIPGAGSYAVWHVAGIG